MILNIVLLGIIAFLLVCLSMVWPPDSPWAPWWRTSKTVARHMCRLAKIGKKDIIYDLGSGDGTALITAAKEFGAKGVGIEIDPLRVFISKRLVRFAKADDKVMIVKSNFFAVDISKATVVFVYLVPKALMRLKKKMLKELKPGTRIVSYRYTIGFLPLVVSDKKNKIHVYKVPNSSKYKVKSSKSQLLV